MISDEGVKRGDASHRSVEIVEEFVADLGGDFRPVAEAKHIFVSDDTAIRLTHRLRNGFPIEWSQCPQVNQLDTYAMFSLDLLRRLQRPRHHGAISDHSHVSAFAHRLGLAEGDAEIRARISSAAKSLAIKALVFQEHHRIITADG